MAVSKNKKKAHQIYIIYCCCLFKPHPGIIKKTTCFSTLHLFHADTFLRHFGDLYFDILRRLKLLTPSFRVCCHPPPREAQQGLYIFKKKKKRKRNNTPFRHQKINSVSREAPLTRGIYSNTTTRARQKARGWWTSCGTQIKEPPRFLCLCNSPFGDFFFLNDRGIVIDCLNVASFRHNETLSD